MASSPCLYRRPSEVLQHQLGHQGVERGPDPDILREGSPASLFRADQPGVVVRLTGLVELAAVGGDAIAVEEVVDEAGLGGEGFKDPLLLSLPDLTH